MSKSVSLSPLQEPNIHLYLTAKTAGPVQTHRFCQRFLRDVSASAQAKQVDLAKGKPKSVERDHVTELLPGVCVYSYMYICIHTFIYMYIHVHIYMYPYTSLSTGSWKRSEHDCAKAQFHSLPNAEMLVDLIVPSILGRS